MLCVGSRSNVCPCPWASCDCRIARSFRRGPKEARSRASPGPRTNYRSSLSSRESPERFTRKVLSPPIAFKERWSSRWSAFWRASPPRSLTLACRRSRCQPSTPTMCWCQRIGNRMRWPRGLPLVSTSRDAKFRAGRLRHECEVNADHRPRSTASSTSLITSSNRRWAAESANRLCDPSNSIASTPACSATRRT